MKNVLKFILIIVKSILIFIGFFLLTDITAEHIIYDAKIANFKAKGEFQEAISTSSVRYYKVSIEKYGYKTNRPGYMKYNNSYFPGFTGDFIATPQAEVGGEFIRGFVSWSVGGHSAILSGTYKDYEIDSDYYEVYEAMGLDPGVNPATITNAYVFVDNTWYDEVMALRADLTDEQIDKMLSFASGEIGDPYNYSFGFHDAKNKSFCTDLVTKAYDEIGINLNKDGFFVTVYDLIVSNDVYLSYYHCFNNGVKYIYYLE